MRVCLGGTFDQFHQGHQLLIQTGFQFAGEDGFVFIGITDQKITDPSKKISSFDIRKKHVLGFIQGQNYKITYIIEKITTVEGPLLQKSFDAVIVSPETRSTAELINQQRLNKGMEPFQIIQIPFVLAEDGDPISASRIRKGEITPDGKSIFHK
jgi:pantetheine-phosphate adenylyltransferase